MTYNWQQRAWPDFSYDLQTEEDTLFAFAEATGILPGVLKPCRKTGRWRLWI